MKPIREVEAQYIWSQKSKRYKKRYFDDLRMLYQEASSEEVKQVSKKVIDKYQLALKNLAQR